MTIDDPNKLFLKRFFQDKDDDKRKVKELKSNSLGGYVDSDNQPYDRLRRSLKRLFGPGYPDVFDYGGGNDQR